MNSNAEDRIPGNAGQRFFELSRQVGGSPGRVGAAAGNQIPYQHRSGWKRKEIVSDQDPSWVSGLRLQNEESLSFVHLGESRSFYRSRI